MARGRVVGSNLGTTSYENGDGPSLAQVRRARYVCSCGHITDVPFSAEATDLPAVWDCSGCGQAAVADGLDPQVAEQALAAASPTLRHGKPIGGKTPWEHVRERRSLDDLEVILAERLELHRRRLRATA